MRVAHPKEANPHRGYSYVGQEKLSRVAGFEKGQISDQAILDIKVSKFFKGGKERKKKKREREREGGRARPNG
jgi:hypothetical protein